MCSTEQSKIYEFLLIWKLDFVSSSSKKIRASNSFSSKSYDNLKLAPCDQAPNDMVHESIEIIGVTCMPE